MIIEWLAIMVVFVSTPETIGAGIIKHTDQYSQRDDCERAVDKANGPLKTIVKEEQRTTKAVVWMCMPVVEAK
jgi:hypothetical protein